MATLDDLATLAAANPQVREDLIATLSAFCDRHGITVSAADFSWDDSGGHALATPPASGIFVWRDGPSTSRFMDSGLKAGPGSPAPVDLRGSSTP